MSSWTSYPKIYALGHKHLTGLFTEPVLIEEKIDGSQFSFGKFQVEDDPGGWAYELRCRSKGVELDITDPEKMFAAAVATAKALEPILHPGWTYRAEFLSKPKHNALAYDRIPHMNLILFDIATGPENYLSPWEKAREADRLGLEVVPMFSSALIRDIDHFRTYLDNTSILGGQKIEGVVVKNYDRFSLDGKPLFGKFVSEAFKEVHKSSWKADNPKGRDIIGLLIDTYKTPARWNKAVQHLRERGALTDAPQDIPALFKEVHADLLAECGEEIRQRLFDWAWKQVARGATGGLPEWYKQRLLEAAFDAQPAENTADNLRTEAQDA